jgi:Nif-specific regulatory protein
VSERFAGRYALLQRIGQGGMGEVFLARDLASGAECALKRLSPDRRTVLDPGEVLREFELLTRVRHPAVVSVHELGFDADGAPYYTMEYVPGLPADRALARGDWPALYFVAAQVAHGLEAIHAARVTHGDLKPSNLLVLPGPAGGLPAGVRLLDFGLAALLGRDTRGHRGTPGYAPPEVVRGGPPSPAGDLYGFGSLLYTLIVGEPAFEGARSSQLLQRQQAGPPSALPLEEAGASEPLVQLVLRLMAADPLERPRDAREVRRELERMHVAARRPLSERLDSVVVVGRERELSRLERAGAGPTRRSRVTVITGEAGAGKSVLLRELAARATLGGRAVIQLSCVREDAGTARAVLRRFAVEAGADPDAGALGTLTEEPLEESAIETLVEAAVEWTRALARPAGGPLVLLDDAELLDPVSRALIRRLVLHPAAAPTGWVWARRATLEGPSDDERVLVEAGIAESLELGPLDMAGVERLAAARLNEPPPAGLRMFLWDRAGGHPGLTIELLRRAASAGALRETDEGLVLDEHALEAVRVPATFEASLLTRHDALPAKARAAAAALAVLGRAVSPEALRRVEPTADATAIGSLVGAGLATHDPAGLVSLVPPALGDRLLERLDPESRRVLHQGALAAAGASRLERFRHLSGAGDTATALAEAAESTEDVLDEPLAVAAAALAESHAPDEAGRWHERAAAAMFRRGRYAAAIPYLERAHALAKHPEARASCAERLALAYFRAGRLDDVARNVAAALAEDPPPVPHSRLLTSEAARLDRLGERAAALEAGERALLLGKAADDDESIARAAQTLATLMVTLERFDDAAAMAKLALDSYRKTGSAIGVVRATGLHAMIARRRRVPDEAEKLYREALIAARAGSLRLAIEEILLSLSALLVETGRWTAAREAAAEALRIALEDGRPAGASLAMASLAQMDGLAGRAAPARRRALAAVRLANAFRPDLESLAWRSLAQAHRIAGRLRSAERSARHALALAMRGGSSEERQWCRVEFARLCIARRRWAEAGDVCDRALDADQASWSVVAALLASLSGRAALRRDDHDVAARRLAALEQWLAGHPAPYAEAAADQLRAELALAQRRVPEGVERAARTLDRLAALPAPPDRALAAMDFARLAMVPGGDSRTPVKAWLEQAAAVFERLGDHGNRERALGLHVRWLSDQLQRTPAGSHPRSLLDAVSRLLNSLSDPRELTKRAMQMVVEQLDAERGVLLFAAPGSDQLEPIAEYGAVDATTRRDAVGYSRRVVERVARGGSGLLIKDAPSDPRAGSQSVVDLRLRSIVCVPMFLGGRVVGAVYLDDSRRADAFGDADRAMLDGFAQLMAVAIENSRGHEEIQRTNRQLVTENLSLRQEVGTRFRAHNLIGTSSGIQPVLATIERVAHNNTTVLITGENGTGKELVARILHHASRRKLQPFVSVNCAAIPEMLIESELFGHTKGAFTDAKTDQPGKFLQANGGTLFLDEIGEMPLGQQVKLLSVISSREVTPVGGGEPVAVDVRIIAATNRDLSRMLEEGTFREDLYYRLNVIPIRVPPLRERKADIPSLAKHFVAHFAEQQERPVPELSAEFMAALMQSDWPGNIRELQNYIERVLAMSPGSVLYPSPLPRDLEETDAAPVRSARGRRLAENIEQLERQMLGEALERSSGNQSHAARELGMTEQSIRYRIRKYGLAARQNRRFRKNRR